jgi:hypothetical protein
VFLERIRNGATLAEASLIATPWIHHNYEYVGDPFLKLPRPLPADCNSNGIDDYLEGADDNNNAILDACEADCDADGLNDECTLLRNLATDCNFNTVPDLCEVCSGASTDCDFNLLPAIATWLRAAPPI